MLNASAADYKQTLRDVIKAEQPRIFLDAVTGPLASTIFDAMPRRARWIIYGRLDPSATTIREPGQFIFQHKQVEGFWLTDWMRGAGDRRLAGGARRAEAFRRRALDDRRHGGRAARRGDRACSGGLAKPNGKVFIAP